MACARILHLRGQGKLDHCRIEQFGTRQRLVVRVPATRDQDLTVRQQTRTVSIAADTHRRSCGKAVSGGIVEFRRTVAVPARDQHAAVIQQRRGMARTGLLHLRTCGEFARLEIVKLGRIERAAARIRTAAGHQHAAIFEQRRRMVDAIGAHRAG
jgi:hypothetical protein